MDPDRNPYQHLSDKLDPYPDTHLHRSDMQDRDPYIHSTAGGEIYDFLIRAASANLQVTSEGK
jgi:hypothetical protein